MKSAYLHLPPSLARFSPTEPDVIVYSGYGLRKLIQFYSLSQRKVSICKRSVLGADKMSIIDGNVFIVRFFELFC